jgi:hypothetical protein
MTFSDIKRGGREVATKAIGQLRRGTIFADDQPTNREQRREMARLNRRQAKSAAPNSKHLDSGGTVG